MPRSPTLKTGSFALEWARERGCTQLGEEVPPTETRLTPPTRLHMAIAPSLPAATSIYCRPGGRPRSTCRPPAPRVSPG